MGSDLYLNPPPPPPLHEQVRALVDRNEQMRQQIERLKTELDQQRSLITAQNNTIANQAIELGKLRATDG